MMIYNIGVDILNFPIYVKHHLPFIGYVHTSFYLNKKEMKIKTKTKHFNMKYK